MEQAEILTRLRKEKGLSQAEVAEELGVTRQAVSRWEAGRTFPSMEKQLALSRLYGVSPEELYRKTEEEAAPPDEEEQKTEETRSLPQKKRSHKNIWRVTLAAVIFAGVLLWGKLTNSMGIAKMILEFGALLILSGWLFRNLRIVFSYFKNKEDM